MVYIIYTPEDQVLARTQKTFKRNYGSRLCAVYCCVRLECSGKFRAVPFPSTNEALLLGGANNTPFSQVAYPPSREPTSTGTRLTGHSWLIQRQASLCPTGDLCPGAGDDKASPQGAQFSASTNMYITCLQVTRQGVDQPTQRQEQPQPTNSSLAAAAAATTAGADAGIENSGKSCFQFPDADKFWVQARIFKRIPDMKYGTVLVNAAAVGTR